MRAAEAIRTHWHPVLPSWKLRRRPVAAIVGGMELCIVREGERVRVLEDGWDASEYEGAIWVKPQGVDADFPDFVRPGFARVCTKFDRVAAPLELTVDNFVEIEHSGIVHLAFGLDPSRCDEASLQVQTTAETVLTLSEGPQRPIPWAARKLFALGRDDRFRSEAVIRFSPVYGVFEGRWLDPNTREVRSGGLLNGVFFNPISDDLTEVINFFYVAGPIASVPGFQRIIYPLYGFEVWRDKKIIEAIADKNPSLKGMRLGRFDRMLGPIRQRIDSVYRQGNAREEKARLVQSY